jgi:uncharacterized protein (DUF608 family)
VATKLPYPKKELFRLGKPRVYRGRELDNIAFPLGGIGTGSISLGGWGQLRDFEIFNRPAKGLSFASTFFTLFAQRKGEKGVTRIVQGPVGGVDFAGDGSGNANRAGGGGLPHFQEVEFEGAFPFARLRFRDRSVPLQVSLEAYNPFIPLNPDDSSLPAAIFYFTLKNSAKKPVQALLCANLENRCGHPDLGNGRIETFDSGKARGLKMSTQKHASDSPRLGTLALVGTGWGLVRQQKRGSKKRVMVEVKSGKLEVQTLQLSLELQKPSVTLAGKKIAASVKGAEVRLAEAATVEAGQTLIVEG